MHHLDDLGFGRTSIESQMLDEVHEFLGEIRRKAEDHPDGLVDFRLFFSVSVVNILWALVAGKRFRRDDAKFHRLLTILQSLFRINNQLRAATPVPSALVRLFPFLKKYIGLRDELFEPIQQFVLVSCILPHKLLIEYILYASSAYRRTLTGICVTGAVRTHPVTLSTSIWTKWTSRLRAESNRLSPVSVAHFVRRWCKSLLLRHGAAHHLLFAEEQLASIVLDLFGAGADSTSNSVGKSP